MREAVVHPGQWVGGWRIERKLGAGGFGHVYLARRDGVACALKFTHPGRVGDWAWRELYILQRHEFPHVVRLLGHFKWPEERPEYLVLVMEYVPGPTLYQWARDTNPCARQVVQKLLQLAQALRPVHAREVLHRDLKGDNILVREPDGAPVLVDFGAGTMRGVPRATREGLAPANVRYRSPESIAFFLRTHDTPGERYSYSVTDEMYALGVILYVLLADQYPFGGSDEEVMRELVTREPQPPSRRNARVPPALDGLCLRLLAQEPRARVPDTEALCEALVKLLEEAKGDARWELPLCYGWTEEGLTTENAPEVDEPSQVWMRRWLRRKPRRGPRPPAPAAEPSALAPPSVPLAGPRPFSSVRNLAGGMVLVGLVVLGGLSVFSSLERRQTRVWTVPRTYPLQHQPQSILLDLSPDPPGPWTVAVHEVAPPWKPLEAGASAAPPRADTPAPVTPVMPHTEAPRMKKPSASPMTPRQACGPAASGLLLGMAATQLACPSPTVQVQPPPPLPPSMACPEGAVATMRDRLGLPIGNYGGNGDLPGRDRMHPIILVQEGPTSLTSEADWDVKGRTVLPRGTRYSGQLYFGEKRVYGHITQAVTPNGDTFTVCIQPLDYSDATPGMEIESRDGQRVRLYGAVRLKTVDHFDHGSRP